MAVIIVAQNLWAYLEWKYGVYLSLSFDIYCLVQRDSEPNRIINYFFATSTSTRSLHILLIYSLFDTITKSKPHVPKHKPSEYKVNNETGLLWQESNWSNDAAPTPINGDPKTAKENDNTVFKRQ